MNFEDLEAQESLSELETLRKENSDLKSLILALKNVCLVNDLEEEVAALNLSIKTQEEQICLDGLKHLSVLFKNGSFTKDDAMMFDILHKNYRMIQGKEVPQKKKEKKADIHELLRIVEQADEQESKKKA